ncbi:MAG: hypothetical protein JNK82_42550 [Myxococcaceae bacterium]|nr:hypothetical protein [Myxococcaceae bacterium]
MTRPFSFLVVVLVVSGCTGMKLSMARQTVSAQIDCPENKLQVREGRDGWYVEGCNTRYRCEVPEGPCAEALTEPQRLARTRETFQRESGCPLMSISVQSTNRGLIAQGCGLYSVCASHDGPCMPSRPPTCAELAQERYDACIETARHDSKTGPQWGYGKYGVAATVANNLIASSQGERMMSTCRQRYDAEAAQCR